MPSKVERWLASKAKKQEGTATDKIRADKALAEGAEEFQTAVYGGLAPYNGIGKKTFGTQAPSNLVEQSNESKLIGKAIARSKQKQGADDSFYQSEYGMNKKDYEDALSAITINDIKADAQALGSDTKALREEVEQTLQGLQAQLNDADAMTENFKAYKQRYDTIKGLVSEYRDYLADGIRTIPTESFSNVDVKVLKDEAGFVDFINKLPDEQVEALFGKVAFVKEVDNAIKELEQNIDPEGVYDRDNADYKYDFFGEMRGADADRGRERNAKLEQLRDLQKSVYENDFVSGWNETADIRDIGSFGLSSLASQLEIASSLSKAEQGLPLTFDDKFNIKVDELTQALEQIREERGGASFLNSLGSGAAHSAQFVVETVMTGGLGGAAKAATSGVKQAFKQGIRQGLKQLAFKNVPRTIVYGAKRSPLMAGTYRNLMDRRINQYSVANGQVDLTKPESLWKSIGVAWTDQSFEIASELWGNMLHLGFGKIGKAMGADKWLKTKSVSFKTTPAMRRVLRDGLLWSGDMPSEITSEFLGDVATNLAYSAFNEDEQYWGELFTWNYWGNLLALTAGLKAGVTVASIPSIVDSNKKVKQLEARSAEAFNAIGNEELKNKVLNLGGRTDIEDVAEYMHSIDWSQYKPIEVAHAIDYMMSEVERQVVAGSEAEQERAERYAPRLARIQELAYRNAEGVAMPTMVTAEANFGADNTQGVTILEGDYANPEAMVRVRLADGTTDVVLGEKLSNVQETDMSALVAEDYAMTFAEEDAMETLGEVEQTLFDMQRTGASNTQQIRAVEKAGLTVFNEGEIVTLLNGEEATVVEGFRHGLYTVMRADGSLSMVGVGGILQPDVAMAQAQRSAAMPQEQTPLTQSTPLPEGIDTTTDYATPDGFVGKAVDYNAESDQVTLQSADGGLTNVPRASLTTANAEQTAPQEDITENLATETISEMEQGEAEATPMPVAPQTAPIPQNADGSVDYESMTDATMYANALESDMGNVADAQEAVADVRQSKEAELAKLQEQKKQTANMNEKVALKQQEQKLVQQIAMLNEVESILGSRATAVEAETAQVNEAVETAPIAEATTEQTAPTTEQKKPTEPTRAEVEGVKDNYLATQLRNENPAEYNTFNALAKLLGLEIEFVESAGEGNALIVGNKMQVAYNPANREETLRFLIGHESLHRLKQVAPEAYAELMEDVKSYIGEELFGQRVERLRVRYEHQGIAITEESLEEEVVADFIGEMEEDYNVVSDLVTNNPNKSWWQKLIEGLRNLFAFLEAAEADTTKVASILNKIETAYKTAAEKVQTLEVETVNGEVSAEINEAEGQAKLSIRTYEEGGRATLVDFLQKQQAKDALTAEEADDILAQMDNLYTICKEYKDKYAPFGQWSDASVVVGEDGKPVFSVIKKNGEYAMNLDFSLVCKKRRTLDAVLNEMVKRGLIEGISVSETTIAKINEVIRRYGFETACALCFVDARRFRVLKVAKDFADLYNSVVDKLIPKGSNIAVNEFNYGGREGVVEKDNALDTMADESLNISALQKMSEGKSVKARIAQHLLDKPQDRKYVTPSDFVSTAGFDNVAANNVPLLKLYNAKKGTGGPKAAFSDVQYLNDIARKNWSVEDAFAVGGVRIQSFSDFVPRMVFDYMQMVAELAGKRLPAHAYTKEAIFAKMFGLTGIKINLSLVPDVVEGGVAAGLDANGDYVWRDGETFPYEEAVALQNAEGYKENCGTIAVGVSDEHILKMLDDPHIRMVIPYHKSGLNPLVAKMNNIGAYKDYTKEQSTRTAKGNSRTKEQKAQLPEPSFNELLRESNSPMEAAQKYLDWCKEHNLKPKFDRFASHPNYYKLLEDFTTYVDGTYVPQRSVTMTYPTAENAFGSISELIAQGLEEDAILEGQRDAKVSQMVDEIEGAKYSLIGEKGASALDAFEESTTRLDNLNVAREMEASGKDAKTIKMATGWERGVDGLWRYEIEEDIPKDFFTKNIDTETTLGEVLGHNHYYFKAYPSLADIKVFFSSQPHTEAGIFGGYNPIDRTLLMFNSGENLETFVHEIQHAIQVEEGFAIGGGEENFRFAGDTGFLQSQQYIPMTLLKDNSKRQYVGKETAIKYGVNSDFLDILDKDKLRNSYEARKNEIPELFHTTLEYIIHNPDIISREQSLPIIQKVVEDAIAKAKSVAHEKYRRIAGEVEARNIEARLNMTPEERLASLVKETEDVAREDQIILRWGLIEGAKFSLRDLTEEEQNIIATAKANGTYLKAPNGKDTNLTPEQWVTVRTKAFKKWFGDWENDPENASKIVDENGEPKIVYHGTPKGGFTIFNTKPKGKTEDTGAWFAADRSNAITYSGRNYEEFATPKSLDELKYFIEDNDAYSGFRIKEKYYIKDEDGGEWEYDSMEELETDGWEDYQPEDVKTLYILYNGFDFVDEYTNQQDLLEGAILEASAKAEMPMLYEVFLNIRDPYIVDAEGKNWQDLDLGSTDATAREGRYGGYDGTIIYNVEDGGDIAVQTTTDYIVHEPNQIKSATDNVGTFDVNNPDIRYSLRNPEWQSQFGVPLADGKELSLEDVRTLFEKTNKRKVLQQMFDKVYEVMEKLPYYGIIVTSQMPEGSEDSLGVADGKGNILLNVRMFQEISNKGIATTILHEMIHSATTYATIAYEERNENPEAYKALPENIKTACQRLQNIYDFLLKRNNLKEEYGMTSIHEMLAELSNPQFRALLREEGVWEKLVNALKRFFGIGTGKTVKELDETLKTFLENFDRSAYVETVEAIAGEKVFERKVDAKETDNQGKEVKYSLKELDAPYLAAVERGDMATAERMVREAAAIAMPNTKVVDEDGLPKVVYHGTGSNDTFNVFDLEDSGMIFMTSSKGIADQYTHKRGSISVSPKQTGRIMPLFANIETPLVVDANKRLWRNLRVDWSEAPVSTRDIALYAKENGYDGVIIKRVRDNMFDDDTRYSDVYIAFNPSQVKSAGALYSKTKRSHFPWDEYEKLEGEIGVTYDDAGNIIPLSERFNPEKEDIRYSLREATGEEVKEYLADALRAAYADRLEQIDKRYDYIADTAKKGRRPFIIGDMDAALALVAPDGKKGLSLELQIAYDIANGLKFRWADSEGGVYNGLQEAIGDRKSVAGILDAQEGAYLNEYATRLAEQVGMSAEDVQKVVVNVVRNNPSRKAAIKTLGENIPFEYNERVEQAIEDSRARAKDKEKAKFEASLNSPDGNTPYARLMQDEAVEIVRASDVLRDMRAEIRGLRKKHAESKYEQAVRIEKVRKRITDMVGTYFGRNMNAAEIKTLVNLISKAHTPEALERALDMIQRQEFNVQYRMQRQRKGRLLQNRISFAFTGNEMSVEQYLRQEGVDDATIKRLLSNRFKGVDAKGISVAKFVSAEVAKLMELVNNNINLTKSIKEQHSDFVNALNEAMQKVPAALLNNETLRSAIETLPTIMLMYWQVDEMVNSAKTYEEDLKKLNDKIKGAEEAITFRPENMSDEAYEERTDQFSQVLKELIQLRDALMRQHLADMPAIVKLMTEANNAIEQMLLGGKQLLSEERKALERHKREVLQDAEMDITNYGQDYNALRADATRHKTSKERAKKEEKKRGFLSGIMSETFDSLDQMLRKMGSDSASGMGRTHQRIIGGLIQATNLMRDNINDVDDAINRKLRQLWGGRKGYRSLEDIIYQSQKIIVGSWNYARVMNEARIVIEAGKPRTVYQEQARTYNTELTLGQALYVLSAWNQADGRLKLEHNGFTQDDINSIMRAIADVDARWLDLMDFVIDELLPSRRDYYDEVHRRVNGAYMARVENYFPLKISGEEVYKEADLDAMSITEATIIPSAIINRTHNTKMIDLDVDFFKVLLENVTDMERWAAMVEIRQDMTTILSDTRTRNMMEQKYGVNFVTDLERAMKVAVGTYTCKIPTTAEKALLYITRRWAGSRIAGRISTALKQLVGIGAYGTYATSWAYWLKVFKVMRHPVQNIKEALEMFPMLQQRWKSASSGDVLLQQFNHTVNVKTEGKLEWKQFDAWLDKVTRLGIMPNAAVDLFVSAVMAKATYEWEMERYLNQGLSREIAEQKAKIDAELSYNLTQQSAETMFIGSLQASPSLVSRAATTFMNNPIANIRLGMQGFADIKRALKWQRVLHNERNRLAIEYRKQFIAEGMDEERAGILAEQKALREVQKTKRGGVVWRGINKMLWGYFLNATTFTLAGGIWLLCKYWDDDEKLDEMGLTGTDLLLTTVASPFQAIPVAKQLTDLLIYGKTSFIPMLDDALREFEGLRQYIENDNVSPSAVYAFSNAVLSLSVGVDMNTWINMADGVVDMFNGDWDAGVAKLINKPKSQIKLLIGDRKDGETAKEYMTRVMRTMSIVDKSKIDVAELENYNFELGKWDKPANISDAEKRKVNEIYRQYQAEYKKDMLKRCSEEVSTYYPEVVEKHAEILKDMGVKDNKLALVKYYEQMVDTLTPDAASALERLAVLQAEISATERSLDLMVSQDGKEYIDLLTEEFNLRKEFVAQYEIYENLTK